MRSPQSRCTAQPARRRLHCSCSLPGKDCSSRLRPNSLLRQLPRRSPPRRCRASRRRRPRRCTCRPGTGQSSEPRTPPRTTQRSSGSTPCTRRCCSCSQCTEAGLRSRGRKGCCSRRSIGSWARGCRRRPRIRGRSCRPQRTPCRRQMSRPVMSMRLARRRPAARRRRGSPCRRSRARTCPLRPRSPPTTSHCCSSRRRTRRASRRLSCRCPRR